jgi:hypothetical protein
MFWSTSIIRELVLSLAKVTLKHSVKCIVIYYVVVWQHNTTQHIPMYFTECFSITLARLVQAP